MRSTLLWPRVSYAEIVMFRKNPLFERVPGTAGWGFELTSGTSLPEHPEVTDNELLSWGKVRHATPTHRLPELPGSNNSGEPKALIELF